MTAILSGGKAIRGIHRGNQVAAAVTIAVLAAVPFIGVYPYFVMQALCFSLFACAFNLLIGFGGLLSLGHAMFFGTSGYITAQALKVWQVNPEMAVVLGIVGAVILGAVTGLVAIRREGIYFSMITLALSQLLYFVLAQSSFTYGEDGIQNVPKGELFGILDLSNSVTSYYFVAICSLGGFWLIWRVIHSPYGEVLKAIRENEPRAVSLGYDVERYKLLAYVLSAGLTGFAGALKVFVSQNATLTDVHWTTSGEVVLMTLVGGIGTIVGPVVGAFVVVAMQEYLANLGQWISVIQGCVFVVCVLTFRRGLIGGLMKLRGGT